MEDLLAISRALSDEHRVRALLALERGELCVCQLIELLGLAPSSVSRHLRMLHDAGLLVARKQGRWLYYRRITQEEHASRRAALGAIAWVDEALGRSTAIRSDRQSLRAIRKTELTELCACYSR